MDKGLFVQNVKIICERRGIKPTAACKECGVGGSFLSDINRGQTPSVAKVQQLASYLGVTVSDLLGESTPNVSKLDTNEKTATPEGSGLEAEFTRLFDSLPPERQKMALAMLQALKDSQ